MARPGASQDATCARHKFNDTVCHVGFSRQFTSVPIPAPRRMLQAMGWQGLPGSFWDRRFDSLCTLLAALFQM